MKKIAIIPARSGSKGLPNKNVLLVNGKPLICYTIEAALNSGVFYEIIVSTDSQEYIDIISKYNVKIIKRSPHLASDHASSYVVIEDVLERYTSIEVDYFVLLQPTSPLRSRVHIREACNKFEKNFDKFDFLVSVTRAHKPTTLTRVIDDDETLKNFRLDYSNYTRQQFLNEFSPNGAIFIGKPEIYLQNKQFYGNKSIAYFMDKESSIDIDDKSDFEYFYFLLNNKYKNNLQDKIKNRIQEKKDLFSQKKEITLIGHSILDQWNISELNKKPVINLAISGINSSQYDKFILGMGLISSLGDKVIMMMGTNDIIEKAWTKNSIASNIQKLINEVKKINPVCKIFFLEITPVCLRLDRNNTAIFELNKYLKEKLHNIEWIDLYDKFCDKYQKLDLRYTDDGLHLNDKGYALLEKIICKRIG